MKVFTIKPPDDAVGVSSYPIAVGARDNLLVPHGWKVTEVQQFCAQEGSSAHQSWHLGLEELMRAARHALEQRTPSRRGQIAMLLHRVAAFVGGQS